MSISVPPHAVVERSEKEAPQIDFPAKVEKAKITAYPMGAFFCLGSDFAERFSFYTMRCILLLFLKNVHSVTDKEAEMAYHGFVVFSYVTPIFGSMLADGCLGRYVVIILVSLVHCAGHGLMTAGAIPSTMTQGPRVAVLVLSLAMVAIGTGGIRSCVSSFINDQFPRPMATQRRRFAAFFYLAITVSALLAEYVAPLLRKVRCFQLQFCYPLAFGFPTIVGFIGCKVTVQHHVRSWLDPAEPLYGAELVADIKTMWRTFLLFLVAVPFWALYDQQGSTWILQANEMDGTVGRITLLPDQISILNTLFICILLPFFVLVLYPFLWKRGFLVMPLRRMGYGCGFLALSFGMAGFVQKYIDSQTQQLPPKNFLRVVIINLSDCEIQARASNEQMLAIPPGMYKKGDYQVPIQLDFQGECQNFSLNWLSANDSDSSRHWGQMIVFWTHNQTTLRQYSLDRKGNSLLHILAHPSYLLDDTTSSVLLKQNDVVHAKLQLSENGSDIILIEPTFFSRLVYDTILQECNNTFCVENIQASNETMKMGSQYALVLGGPTHRSLFIELVSASNVSMLWMTPQYALISVAEILFVLSGSEFAYSQAAPSMKSTMHSAWLLMTALGNALIMALAGLDLAREKARLFFLCVVFMGIALCIFMYFARKYKYVDHSKVSAKLRQDSHSK